jgi:hypothetical protein
VEFQPDRSHLDKQYKGKVAKVKHFGTKGTGKMHNRMLFLEYKPLQIIQFRLAEAELKAIFFAELQHTSSQGNLARQRF